MRPVDDLANDSLAANAALTHHQPAVVAQSESALEAAVDETAPCSGCLSGEIPNSPASQSAATCCFADALAAAALLVRCDFSAEI